jgi:hypothetical protein
MALKVVRPGGIEIPIGQITKLIHCPFVAPTCVLQRDVYTPSLTHLHRSRTVTIRVGETDLKRSSCFVKCHNYKMRLIDTPTVANINTVQESLPLSTWAPIEFPKLTKSSLRHSS